MPDFLDAFVDQIRFKKDSIGEKIVKGRVSKLDNDLRELIRGNWHANVDLGSPEIEVIAVDGSRALRPIATGAILYTVRALALAGKQRFKELEVESFLSKANSNEIVVFVNTKMEWLEFKIALKAVKETNFSKTAVLIDGSLYGRLTHLPHDQPAEGMRAFMVDYFETFYELLETCRRRNILVLGISKDSRSDFLRNFLLRTIFDKEMDNLENIAIDHKERLKRIFDQAFENPSRALNVFRGFKNSYGDKMSKIEHILDEAMAARPDHQLIRNYINEPGHTIPIELSVSRQIRERLLRMQKDPAAYVKSYFREARRESLDKEGFLDYASDVISKIPQFPTMISFHLLLDGRDTPMRVDTPSWTYNMKNKIVDLEKESKALVNVNNIVSLLLAGYAGLKNYNVWLKRVDEEVRLNRVIFDQLYVSRLEKVLNAQITFSRGYRRVDYP